MSGANVFIHESQFPEAIERELIRSLRARRINHKFHYETPKQALKWLALHEAHSPARNDAQVLATYDQAFNAVAAQLKTNAVRVIGLGCGGGQKDVRLLELLARRGRQLAYTPCDVSVPLVLVARERALSCVDELNIHPLVCDLALTKDFNSLLPNAPNEHRLITFFGMIPNFEPHMILPKLAQMVRPSDQLLFSANLVPGAPVSDPARWISSRRVGDRRSVEAAMSRILPQYDNELTREWLLTFLFDHGIERADGNLQFSIEVSRGLPRFVARFCFTRPRELRVGSRSFTFRAADSIQLFFSYRYTPQSLSRVLEHQSLLFTDSWLSRSCEEGIFLVRRIP